MITADDLPDAIVVVGMSARFPGAPDIEAFWALLCEGREGIRFFTDEELLAHGALPEELRHPRYVRAAALLDEPDLFDAEFFAVNPRDAELMDPQQRVMLEVAYVALEDAGYGDPGRRPVTGVFVGSSMSHYAFQIYSHGQIRGPSGSLQAFFGNGESHLATRISYKLDLRGPSMFVQTACSTSLTAVHLACRSLLSRECDMALAGGVSITVPKPAGYIHMEGGVLSPDGHCRSFDAEAGGTVIGNGAGAVVLRRFADAVADGDRVLAVILGSAVNNDGADKMGYTAPSSRGQETVIAEALALAGVEPSTVSFIEAHGTATILGDPIEVASLSSIYRGGAGSCALSSVKSNFGHLLAAAGIAGFIKAVLALSRRRIPPSVNFRRPNPRIDFASSPFWVPTSLANWPENGTPRRAAVSSFGIGGTNVHVVLQESPVSLVSEPDARPQVLPLSASAPEALAQAAAALAERLYGEADGTLPDAAFTLQVGRRALPLRRVVTARTIRETIAKLEDIATAAAPTQALTGPLALLFPGQGSQRIRMFAELAAQPGAFQLWFNLCARVLIADGGPDLHRVVMAESATEAGLVPTAVVQPALFAVEYALARQWMEWGLDPIAAFGHSVGEYVAACLAGVIAVEDAIRLVALRGRLMQAQPAGAMLSVPLDEAEVQELTAKDLVIAAVNAPRRCVLSGPVDGIAAVGKRLSERGIAVRRLNVSHAFHSPAMEPAAEALAVALARVPLQTPQSAFVSSVTGTWITAEQAQNPLYWARQLVEPVRCLRAIETLAADQPSALLEVGPGAALTGFARAVLPSSIPAFVSDPHPQTIDSDHHFLDLLGRLWVVGVPVEWSRLQQGRRRHRVSLPGYKFERKRFWIEARSLENAPPVPTASPAHQRAADIAAWFYLPSWRRSLSPSELPVPELGAAWLIFADGEGLGRRLTERLRELGHLVITVTPGDSFALVEPNALMLRPDAAGDYNELLDRLASLDIAPKRIVHLWGVGAPPRPWTAANLCFESILLLAQGLGRRESAVSTSLVIVSEGVQRVAGEDALQPEKALGLGPAKVIQQEFPTVSARHVDLIASDWRGARLDRLVAELSSDGAIPEARRRDLCDVVALRGTDRWLQTFEQAKLTKNDAMLVHNGVYLITGGLGGIGLVLAERLSKLCAARVILTTRSSFPAEADWDQLLDELEPSAQTAVRIAGLRRIQEAGGLVRIAQVDITDAPAVTQLIRDIVAEFGRLNGVIHAAGAPGGGMIQLKSLDAAKEVLAPKVRGVRALESGLNGLDIDFLVLCSSLSSVRGGLGQVDYCAANAFLDAHAQSCAGRDRRTLSINWGAWAEVGMAVTAIKRYGFLPCPFWLRDGGNEGPVQTHPLLDRIVRSANGERALRTRLRPAEHWVLAEHRLNGRPTMPGTGHLELLRAAWSALAGEGPIELADVELRAPLSVGEHGVVEALVLAEDDEREQHRLRITTRAAGESRPGEGLLEHVRATVRTTGTAPPIDVAELLARLQRVDGAQIRHSESALRFGPRWNVTCGAVYLGEGEILADVTLPEAYACDLDAMWLHPSLLDVALGAAKQLGGDARPLLPFGYGRVSIHAPFSRRILCHIRARHSREGARLLAVDASIFDENGKVLVEIDNYQLRAIDPAGHRTGAQAAGNNDVNDVLAGAIRSAEGAEAFMRALASGAPQLVVSPLDLDAVIAKWQTHDQSLVDRIAKAELPRPAVNDGRREARGSVPCGDIERQIANMWIEILGRTHVGRDDDFFALGGDSLLGIQLHSRMRDTFRIDLTLAAVFEHPTISGLAALVADRIDEFANRDGAERDELGAQLTANRTRTIGEILEQLGSHA